MQYKEATGVPLAALTETLERLEHQAGQTPSPCGHGGAQFLRDGNVWRKICVGPATMRARSLVHAWLAQCKYGTR
jgi:hypothetical protein